MTEEAPARVAAHTSRLVDIAGPKARALIYPELGFQLWGFEVLGAHGADGGAIPIIHAPVAGVAREPADRRYGNPILFPCPGVSNASVADSWEHGGRVLPMPQHGWARNLCWQVVSRTADSVTGLLVPNSGMRAVYPFEFELSMRYRIEAWALVLEAELSNTGAVPLPYALGFHPYVRAPLALKGGASACTVALPHATRLSSRDGWRTIERAPFPARVIAADWNELPGSVVLTDTEVRSLVLRDLRAGLSVQISVADSPTPMPVWVVWNPAPDAGYVCLEPWTDAPNALVRGSATWLAPAARHAFVMRIEVANA